MDYWLVDDAGGLRQRFEILAGSLEDELHATLFVVEAQALVRLQVRQRHGRKPTVDRAVEIDGLIEVPAGDKAAHARVLVAVADERARQDAMDRRGQARLAAIAGPQETHDAGDDFRAARHVLEWYVTQYDDQRSKAMLRALLRFGDLYASVPAIKPALDQFAMACRHAFQHRTLPYPDVIAPATVSVVWMSARQREQASEIAAALRDIERELKVDADIQEDVDAHLNAVALRTAASRVAEARALFARMLERAP